MKVFRTFTDQHLALQAVAELRQNGLEADLAQEHIHGALTFLLQIAPEQESLATAILDNSIPTEEMDHNYLASLSDEELLEILINRHTYHESMAANAQELLKQRQPTLDLEAVTSHHEQVYLEELSHAKRGKKLSRNQLIWAYLSILGFGMGGMIVGITLSESRQKGPDGESYFTYPPRIRKHGKNIFALGCFTFVLGLSFKIWHEINMAA